MEMKCRYSNTCVLTRYDKYYKMHRCCAWVACDSSSQFPPCMSPGEPHFDPQYYSLVPTTISLHFQLLRLSSDITGKILIEVWPPTLLWLSPFKDLQSVKMEGILAADTIRVEWVLIGTILIPPFLLCCLWLNTKGRIHILVQLITRYFKHLIHNNALGMLWLASFPF